jgi:hypothetical protein
MLHKAALAVLGLACWPGLHDTSVRSSNGRSDVSDWLTASSNRPRNSKEVGKRQEVGATKRCRGVLPLSEATRGLVGASM